jgi:hypothetical protein
MLAFKRTAHLLNLLFRLAGSSDVFSDDCPQASQYACMLFACLYAKFGNARVVIGNT